MGDENIRETNMLPPPAPRKVYVRKMINVSARVRRKLNFDVAEESPDAKKVKLGSVSNYLFPQSNTTCTFQPIAIRNTLLPPESTTGAVAGTQLIERTPTRTAPLSTQTNLNELMNFEKEGNDNRTLKVDSATFTTPDKCICKNSRETSEFVSRIKPLRL